MAKWQKDGFDFVAYSGDHMPPHIHIWKAGAEIKIKYSNLEIIENYGMSLKDARNAKTICEENKLELRRIWNKANADKKIK